MIQSGNPTAEQDADSLFTTHERRLLREVADAVGDGTVEACARGILAEAQPWDAALRLFDDLRDAYPVSNPLVYQVIWAAIRFKVRVPFPATIAVMQPGLIVNAPPTDTEGARGRLWRRGLFYLSRGVHSLAQMLRVISLAMILIAVPLSLFGVLSWPWLPLLLRALGALALAFFLPQIGNGLLRGSLDQHARRALDLVNDRERLRLRAAQYLRTHGDVGLGVLRAWAD